MSKVADVRAAMESIIQGVLPDYTLLSDSFDVIDNALQLLNQGFAIAYGAGEGIYLDWCPGQIRQRREFRVPLTNLYNPTTKQEKRISLETSLMNDQLKIIAAISSSVTLGGVAINAIFSYDQGIQYLETKDGKDFIMIVSSFTVEYIEGV